ncbi:hypothetical protein OAB03_00645 [Planktomarina temperata]|nr:hypothetical protein [Planktomarina temperata]
MDDFYKLLYFTPMENDPMDEIPDNKIEIIHSFLIDVDLLTLRVAQLEYNSRVRSEQKNWWDDLKVYLGVPKTNIRDLSILDTVTTVPFGLLYELFSISGSNQDFTIKYNWDILDRDGLFHTNVDEFSTYCLAQEWEIQNDEGFLKQFSGERWIAIQPELKRQIVDKPNVNVIKKSTLAIIELMSRNDDFKRFERLNAFVKIFSLLRGGTFKFSMLEEFVDFDREIADSAGGYVHENKAFGEFDLEDFFDFGFQIIGLSDYYNHDFKEFLESIEEILAENNEEKWSSETLELFGELYEKHINNNET